MREALNFRGLLLLKTTSMVIPLMGSWFCRCFMISHQPILIYHPAPSTFTWVYLLELAFHWVSLIHLFSTSSFFQCKVLLLVVVSLALFLERGDFERNHITRHHIHMWSCLILCCRVLQPATTQRKQLISMMI